MVNKPSYEDLEQKINQLESEIIDYVSKKMAFSRKKNWLKKAI